MRIVDEKISIGSASWLNPLLTSSVPRFIVVTGGQG